MRDANLEQEEGEKGEVSRRKHEALKWCLTKWSAITKCASCSVVGSWGEKKRGNSNCLAFLSPTVQSSFHQKQTPLHLIGVFIQKSCQIPCSAMYCFHQSQKVAEMLDTDHARLPGQVTSPSLMEEILSNSRSTTLKGRSHKMCMSGTIVKSKFSMDPTFLNHSIRTS